MFEKNVNMKTLLFFGYIFVAFMLYFVPSKIWHDEKLALLSKYSNYSDMIERAFIMYEDFKELNPKNATDDFIQYIEILASKFETVCTVQQHYKAIISTTCSAEPINSLNTCDIKSDLQILLKDWKSSNDPISEFKDLVKVFAVIVDKDAFVSYLIQVLNYNVQPIKNGSPPDTSVSELVNMSKQNINDLLAHVGLIRQFLDEEIDRTQKYIKDMSNQNHDYSNIELEDEFYKMNMNLKLLIRVKFLITDALLKILTLLKSQNFWEKSMTAGVEVQIYFFALNTFLMLAMYFYPFYVYFTLFHLLLFICRIYKRFIGDPVYLRSTYIFSFLQTTTAENEMKHRNRKRARNKHRRIRKM